MMKAMNSNDPRIRRVVAQPQQVAFEAPLFGLCFVRVALYDGIDFPVDKNKLELIGKLMTDYAKYYHIVQSENCLIADVLERTLERKLAEYKEICAILDGTGFISVAECAESEKLAVETNAQINLLRFMIAEVD